MTDPLSRNRAVEMEYTLGRNDMSHMIRAVYRSGRAGWLLGPVGAMVIGGFWLMIVAGTLLTGDLGFVGWLALAMPVVILLMPEWMAVAWVRMSRDASRTFRTTVDDNGLRTAGAHSETIADWKQYGGFRETEHYFELPLNGTMGRQLLVLPKRVLSEADMDLLREKLSNNLTDLSKT